jgi:rare lipoprotein A
MKSFVLYFLFSLSSVAYTQTQIGKGSFYDDKFEGRQTANGEIYKHSLPTAAHRKLAFGTKVKVTNLQNYKTAIVTINDRGPFIKGRIIDLSRSVAQSLDMPNNSIIEVKIEVLKDQNVTIALSPISPSTLQTTAIKPSSNKEVTSTDLQMKSENDHEVNEFYQMNINEITPDFFGLQIASFQDTDNLLRMANRLKVTYNTEVLVQIKTVSGLKIYTIILGQYNNRQAAEEFQDKIVSNYPESFIIDMTIKD